MDDTKTLYIDEDIHARVKATAAMSKVSIRAWVEAVLIDALNGEPSASVLVDTRETYTTQEATE